MSVSLERDELENEVSGKAVKAEEERKYTKRRSDKDGRKEKIEIHIKEKKSKGSCEEKNENKYRQIMRKKSTMRRKRRKKERSKAKRRLRKKKKIGHDEYRKEYGNDKSA